MADDSSLAAGDDTAKPVSADLKKPKKKRRGILSRMWNGIFGARSDDYEKKLEHLSKEEALVHARMKRRSLLFRWIFQKLIAGTVILEVLAVAFAFMTTRSLDLNWQMRAIRVSPIFVLPFLSYAIYRTLVSFTRMFDRKDQRTLERLLAERQEKIDELKEMTHYYITQQLIQKYDSDPAAKAAAATVLASKLGADSGLKVYLGDESKNNPPLGKSSDIELVQSDGLRNRKQSQSRSNSTRSGTTHPSVNDTAHESTPDGQEISVENQKVVEHHKSSVLNNGGWIARIAALLVGEDPTQCYALICGNCRMHNGLARKEDFPYITYYCPHCHALNGSQQLEEHESDPSSGKVGLPTPGGNNVRDASNTSVVTKSEVTSNSAAVQELPGGVCGEKQVG